MKEKVLPLSSSPSLEEVLKAALEMLEANTEAGTSYPCFSSPIEVETPCNKCKSTFVTEIYATGSFACLECGISLQFD